MPEIQALITNDIVVLGLIAATLGAVFWTASLPGAWKKFYSFVPALLLCYFIPGIYNTVGLIDGEATRLYNPVASRVLLPAALVLLTLTIDIRGVMRLGPKLVLMYALASLTVMAGAVVAFTAMSFIHPPTMAGDTWGGMAALAGSWIGGGANMLAMKEVFNVNATTFGQFAVIDVGVGYVWMAVLIFLAGHSQAIDARSGADTTAIDDLKERIAKYQAEQRIFTETVGFADDSGDFTEAQPVDVLKIGHVQVAAHRNIIGCAETGIDLDEATAVVGTDIHHVVAQAAPDAHRVAFEAIHHQFVDDGKIIDTPVNDLEASG